jgi:hypothetical protein
MRCWEARKPIPGLLFNRLLISFLRTRMQIKQPSFDSVNADFSVANVIVELLRTKDVHEASVLRFGSGGALGAAR